MPRGRRTSATRLGVIAALLATTIVPTFAGRAAGGETLSQLKNRMERVQERLDAAAARIQDLEARGHVLEDRIVEIERERAQLHKETSKLRKQVIARADELYRSGGVGMVEILFSSEDFAELSDRAEMLSQISLDDSAVFVDMARAQQELDALEEELDDKQRALEETEKAARDEAAELREQFRAIADDYKKLKAEMARRAAARREAAAAEAAAVAARPTIAVAAAPLPRPSGNMTCPVAGPNSFIDSWGYPRSGGRRHEGVDIMADYGTPVVAITSGRITYAGYGGSAGNWQILSGDDGHEYWYMHNQRNIVTGGHVDVGQQIATVGDTGNATGVPHLHFEYHPGGGSPVNPYPLVRPLC